MRVRLPLPSQVEAASKGSSMDLKTALCIVGGYIYFFFPLYFKQNKLSLCCLILALKFSELFQGMNPGCSHGAHKGQNWDKWCHIPRQSSPCALKPSRAIPERGKLNPSGTIPE